MAISLAGTTAQPLPQAVTQLEALALRSGQVVEARVVNAGQGNTVQLAINGQVIDAALAARLQTGELIRLLVQGTGPNQRLTVLPPPTQGSGRPVSPVPAQAVTPPQPASVPVQSQANVARGQLQPVPVPVPGSDAIIVRTAATQPLAAAATQAQAPSQPAIQAQTVQQTHVPRPQPILVTTATPNAPAQATSPQAQTVNAAPPTVAAPIRGAPAPVTAIPQQGLPAQLEPGTVLRFQLQGTGANARPVLVPATIPNGSHVQAQGRPSAQTQIQTRLPFQVAPNPLQQAVTQTVQSAVARQDSIAVLLTSLAGLGAKLSDLPKPVARAGGALLAGRLDLGAKPIDGEGLKQALIRSGVLFENTLSKGAGQPLPQGDLKGQLLKLSNALRVWLGGDAAPKTAPHHRPPPPLPGAPPRANRPVSLPLTPNATSTEIGARLLGQTEAALARMRLTQISSLPDFSARPAQGPAGPSPELNMELPLMLGGEMSVGQFQIFRDGENDRGRDLDGGWKMRFSLNFSQTGEVGATVSLRGGKTGVMLWAEREETAAVLQDMLPELSEALEARGLVPGALRCRHGHPPQAHKLVGTFMDNCS